MNKTAKSYRGLEDNLSYANQKFKKELKSRKTHGNRLKKRKKRINNFAQIKKPDYITFDFPPEDFQLLDNNSEVVHYFELTRKHMKKNTFTRMDLSKIKYIDLPALCLLSAFMLDKPHGARFLEVIVPSNGVVGELFKDAQFENMIVKNQRSYLTNGTFLSRSDKNVNHEFIKTILDRSASFFGTGSNIKLRNL